MHRHGVPIHSTPNLIDNDPDHRCQLIARFHAAILAMPVDHVVYDAGEMGRYRRDAGAVYNDLAAGLRFVERPFILENSMAG